MKKLKNVLSTLGLIVVLAIVLTSCSKDKKIAKQLDGDWKVTKSTTNGVADPDSNFNKETYSFTTCNVKKETCTGTWKETGQTDVPFTWTVAEEKLTVTMTSAGFTFAFIYDVLEHSKTEMKLKGTYSILGISTTSEMTMEKK